MPSGATPSGTWIGQDGHDYVGTSSTIAPDGVQDIHIGLTGLPADRSIAWIDMQGLGGGESEYNGPYGVAAIAVQRASGSTTADLFVDPYQVETGRPFQFTIRYDDGSTSGFWVQGGAADPNLRMPSAKAQLGWIGQDGHDSVGPNASAGPDGVQDVHLTLANLSADVAISALTITSSGGATWQFGANPLGAARIDVQRSSSDPSKADLYVAAQGDPSGQTFTASIQYANGKSDSASVVAGPANPGLAETPTAPAAPVFSSAISATWIGQDGQNLVGPGAARIALSGIPSGRTIVAAALSDPANGEWSFKSNAGVPFYTDPWTDVLAVRANGPGQADVSFPPARNEIGATLTLRVLLDDGSQAVTTVLAGATDPGLRGPMPSSSSVVAKPGDDLNALASRYGTVRLSAGTYPMNAPLTLTQPVSILADPGVALMFTQAANAPSWSAAIKVRASHVTLDGFAVRFSGPVNWDQSVSYGPAVIGTTDSTDTGPSGLVVGLTITHLDLQSPPVPAGANVEAPGMIRLASGLGGTIANNKLNGGTTTFLGGPWSIVGNTYVGTVPNTFTWAAFAGHSTHDVTLSGNIAQPQGGSGKTWRFLVLTGTGSGDSIANNTVIGIGPRDTDTVDVNAAEVILTESYSLDFEGVSESISADGRILRIPSPQGGAARTGDEVAILSGPFAGQFRRISQALGPQVYLMDQPLPAGSYAISIASGFVGEKFVNNTIDCRGSSAAGDLVLTGNHYGTVVANNLLMGGSQGFKISSSPTEDPVQWGWSHDPFLGATIDGNTITDALNGATIGVEHSPAISGDGGRVYFSGTLTDNTVTWSSAFAQGHGATAPGLIVGDPGGSSPGEIALTTGGNDSDAPAGYNPTLQVISGTLDGQAMTNRTFSLAALAPPAPTGLALMNDSGNSASDGLTNDGRIRFNAVPAASGYEFRVNGSTTYLASGPPSGFLPTGLVEGVNTIAIRAIDAEGRRGADAILTFTLDTTPPPAVANLAGTASGVTFSAAEAGASNSEQVGTAALVAIGPATSFVPSGLTTGANRVGVIATDAAGNVGPESWITITVAPDPTPSPTPTPTPSPTPTPTPSPTAPSDPLPTGQWLGQDGHDLVGPSPVAGPDGIQDVHIALAGLRADHAITFVDIEGLGGGQWQYGGGWGPWRAALVRSSGSSSADLYFQPGQVETGRPFVVALVYDDGVSVKFWVAGGAADPSKTMPQVAPAPTGSPAAAVASSPTAKQKAKAKVKKAKAKKPLVRAKAKHAITVVGHAWTRKPGKSKP